MRVLETLRNAIFPPPGVIVGVVLILMMLMPDESVEADQSRGMKSDEAATTMDAQQDNILGLESRLPDQSAVVEITTHPLFSESRRPWQDIVEPEPALIEEVSVELPEPESTVRAVPTPQPQILLLGIVHNDGRLSALIADQSGQSERWIELGTQVQGWTVAEIQSDRLILRSEGEEAVVTYNR